MKIKAIPMLIVLSGALFLLCGSRTAAPAFSTLEVVKDVDLNRYLGLWYEIARLPMYFEKNLVAVTAEYSLRKDGKIMVKNSGDVKVIGGRRKVAIGRAWVPDPSESAKLKVSFFGPFSADYWIIELDTEEYSYAVVGEPDRKYFWILSRTPVMDEMLYSEIVARAAEKGFDVSRLYCTPQSGKDE